MKSRALSRAAVSGVAILALSGLAACGSDTEPTAAASDPTSAPADPADPSDTATVTETSDDQTEAASEGSKVTKEQMAEIFATAMASMTTADITTTMSTMGTEVAMVGQVDMTKTPPDLSMTMDMSSSGLGSYEVRVVDGVYYMNMGAMTSNKFVKMDASDLAASGMGSTDDLNPAAALGEFMDAFKSGTFVGSDGDGDHYELLLDTSEVSDSTLGSVGSDIPDTMTLDLWIKSDQISKAAVDMGSAGSMEMAYSNIGEPVDIVAPKASEITTMPGM